jgi:hypothetical protein
VSNISNIKSDPKKSRVAPIMKLCFIASLLFPTLSYSGESPKYVNSNDALENAMLELLKDFPKDGSQDFVAFISGKPGIYVPDQIPINDDFSKLPALPTQDFRHLLNSFGRTGTSFPLPFDLTWFPQERIGELINVDGSASCSTWIFFSSNGANTFQAKTPNIFMPFICGNDGDPYDRSDGFLIQKDRQIVAIVFKKIEIKFPNFRYSLYWQTLTPLGWAGVESVSMEALSNQ